MAKDSKIEWTDHTFNPWIGCTKVSPGCDHCYAETWAHRYGRDVWGPNKARERTAPSNWRQPHKWDAEAKAAGRKAFVFVASLADVFDNAVDAAWRRDLWDLMIDTPNLIWLVLTKRIGNVETLVPYMPWPDNAWLGATIVCQAEADRDGHKLLAAKRRLKIPRVFLSMEPLLGPVDLTRCSPKPAVETNLLTGWSTVGAVDDIGGIAVDHARVDWVIVGGESGSKEARPMHPEWAKQIEAQCQAAGVPFMFKQWGEWMPLSEQGGSGSWPVHEDWACSMDFGGSFSEAGVKMQRVGKKFAGRRLDGAEHNGRPQP